MLIFKSLVPFLIWCLVFILYVFYLLCNWSWLLFAATVHVCGGSEELYATMRFMSAECAAFVRDDYAEVSVSMFVKCFSSWDNPYMRYGHLVLDNVSAQMANIGLGFIVAFLLFLVNIVWAMCIGCCCWPGPRRSPGPPNTRRSFQL